ncbi:KR domain-containing protein [Dactylonectria macrodidyma]|uniref:KR domain-containing protein n=1 Tax=Dactylonectria macrodidyma TaxID=307937 RepID=A0A9P9JNJ3_9HYPO|nr:KR domain-containing protein [Dactylonectria macrodidyma]
MCWSMRRCPFREPDHEEWEGVVRCKVKGTWNLHHALAKSRLDFFVCLGSCTGTIGNRGQSAYAAANVFLDHFVQWCNSQGLPGTCIYLFAVQGVGCLAREKDREQEVLQTIGGDPITEREVLALLAAAISGEATSSCDSVCLASLKVTTGSRAMSRAKDARFKRLVDAVVKDEGGGARPDKGELSFSQALKTAESTEDALEAIYEALPSQQDRVGADARARRGASRALGSVHGLGLVGGHRSSQLDHA